MNYEDAFKNYENGTATEEEKAFVKAELAKAKSLGNMLEAEVVEEPSPITEAEVTEIKKAKKQFKIKHILFIVGSIICLVLAIFMSIIVFKAARFGVFLILLIGLLLLGVPFLIRNGLKKLYKETISLIINTGILSFIACKRIFRFSCFL